MIPKYFFLAPESRLCYTGNICLGQGGVFTLIHRKFMRTRQLKPGMRVDHPVSDRLGRVLVARGATLDEYIIEAC